MNEHLQVKRSQWLTRVSLLVVSLLIVTHLNVRQGVKEGQTTRNSSQSFIHYEYGQPCAHCVHPHPASFNIPRFSGMSPKNWALKVLSIAVLYYEDPERLAEVVNSWLVLSDDLRRQILFLVIDDGSSLPASDVVRALNGHTCTADILVFRVLDDIPWNIGGSRNLAMFVSPTRYVFLTDLDITVPSEVMASLPYLIGEAERRHDETGNETVFTHFRRVVQGDTLPKREKPHPAVMLLTTSAYWRIGGCDEDFVGNYGFTDPHFMYRASRTPFISQVKCFQNFKELAPLQQAYSSETPDHAQSKNSSTNKLLFEHKKRFSGWSTTFLRFPWRQEVYPCA